MESKHSNTSAVLRLGKKQIEKLKKRHRQERDSRLTDRIKAIIYLGTGRSVVEVADLLFHTTKTIRRWLTIYQQDGIEQLLTLNYQGKQSSLTPQQERELAKHLDKNTYINSKGIRQYIKQKYGIEYSASGVKDLLARLGFVYKKPKHVSTKYDSAKAESFIADYFSLLESKGKNDPIYFVDACHPQYNSMLAYGWIRKGKEKYLKSTGSRKRVNIHGAVNIGTCDLVSDFSKTINSESTYRLLMKIAAKHPLAKVIYVIVDNASYYKSSWLKEMLVGTKIKLIYTPSHSPNLNLIERLWRFFKREILYNTYYETYDEFLDACKSFFRCRTKHRASLRSLLTENFQKFDVKKGHFIA